MTKTTPAERKRKERERDKAQGLIRRDVKARAEDWPEIRALEAKLRFKTVITDIKALKK
jgi:hypothetical protein